MTKGLLRAPNINIFRDPRWDVAGDYGEDPFFNRAWPWNTSEACRQKNGQLKAVSTPKFCRSPVGQIYAARFNAVPDRPISGTLTSAFGACVKRRRLVRDVAYSSVDGVQTQPTNAAAADLRTVGIFAVCGVRRGPFTTS